MRKKLKHLKYYIKGGIRFSAFSASGNEPDYIHSEKNIKKILKSNGKLVRFTQWRYKMRGRVLFHAENQSAKSKAVSY